MKVINREEFLKLPKYTLFCEYEYDFYSQLKVKGETLDSSYSEVDLNEKPTKLEFNRSGNYEENKLYAIYEKEDIENVIKLLKKCL